jgi:hypothetical protein
LNGQGHQGHAGHAEKSLLKTPRNKKLLGLSLGERSLLIAEVIGGERPSVARTAEMPYPAGVTIANPAELGSALTSFIAKEGFTARSVVIGLPARWLVTQPKEMPAADERTRAEMLRLSAEAEFSTELKDLVFDYTGTGTSVLLVATPSRYVEAARAMCETAGLQLLAVTASAVALGEATGRGAARDVLVLSVASGGAEMTLQRDASSGAVRHLRAPLPQEPFINELRRTVSTMPPSKAGRQVVLWDGTGLNAATLGEQIGTPVRSGELSLLGVSSAGGAIANGNGARANGQQGANDIGQYAAAIALALVGMSDQPIRVDFLHSRLAPPKTHRVPRWAIVAVVAVIVLIAGTTYAFHDLDVQSAAVDTMQARYDGMKSRIDDATAFVGKVTFAQAWHGGDPRYLACIRDMTVAMSDDFDTFAIGLIIGDAPRPVNSKAPDTHALTGVLSGKAADQQHVLMLLNRLRKIKAFSDATLGGSDVGRGREVTFSINFRYQIAKPVP